MLAQKHGFEFTPIPVTRDIDVDPEDVVIYDAPGYPPLRVGNGRAATVSTHEAVRVRGDVSSQFLTALLLALPLAAGARDITIEVVGELISKPYIEITIKLMERFGVTVEREGWQIRTAMNGHLCRCGTYPRILSAIKQAAAVMAKGGK